MYGGAPIQWKSKKQEIVTLSSTEAELTSLCAMVKDIITIRNLAKELKIIEDSPTTIYCDNQSAIKLATNERSVHTVRHIGVRAAYTREKVQEGEIVIKHVRTDDNVADMLTKPLATKRFLFLRNKLMMVLTLLCMLSICNGHSFEDTKPVVPRRGNID